MLFPFLACTDLPREPGEPDSTPTSDDSGSITDDSGTDDSGTSGTDDSGTKVTDDSATDDSATDDSGDDTGPKAWVVPDFALVDLNTASPTHGHTISPRDYKKRVSGWYFIHAD